MRCLYCFDEIENRQICHVCRLDQNEPRDPIYLPMKHKLKDGRYSLGPLIGFGSFGHVYKALDNEQGAVAIKELFWKKKSLRVSGKPFVNITNDFNTEYQDAKNCFYDEATHLTQFNSDHVVKAIDFFEENNTMYYVMPYIEGANLKEHCQPGGVRITEASLLPIAKQLVEALQVIHKGNLLHRDIKPNNVVITLEPKSTILIDFGAAIKNTNKKRLSTHFNIFTPCYAPIEQEQRTQDQGTWTDIYALCATLYFCLTGENIVRACYRNRNPSLDPYIPIEQKVKGISEPFACLINRGLAYDRRDRILSADEAINYLEQCSTQESDGNINDNPTANTPPPGNKPVSSDVIGQIKQDNVPKTMMYRAEGVENITVVQPKRLAVEVSIYGTNGQKNRILISPNDQINIGRNGDVAIANRWLSKQHVSIYVSPAGSFTITDLNSTNGTFELQSENEVKEGKKMWRRIKSIRSSHFRTFCLGPYQEGGLIIECSRIMVD